MPFVDLLSADTALVKTFTLNHNVIEKSPYPMVRDFTSHRREVTDLRSLLGVLEEGANKGWCMSKGSLKKQIVNESRAGATDANEGTQVLILDLDGLECMDIDDALNRCGLGNFSHVIQWSASAWITNPIPTTEKTRSPATSPNTSVVSPKGSTATISGHTLVDGSTSPQGPSALAASETLESTTSLSMTINYLTPSAAPSSSSISKSQKCSLLSPDSNNHPFQGTSPLSAHVFFWLSHPVSPALVKAWLKKLNIHTFATSITLTRTGAALHWPIDPSVADNSKLIYIAPPGVCGGLQPPSPAPTITLVEREQVAHSPTTLFTVNPQEVAQERQQAFVRSSRKGRS
jgi:hypothetical protein